MFTVNKNKQNELMSNEIKSGIIDEKKSWSTYEDAEYSFVISYPSYLDKSIRCEVFGEEGKYDPGKLIKSVGFSYNGFGFMGVKIYSNINLKDIDEYLEFKNSQRDMTCYELEKEFLIDEIPVVVFHSVTVPLKKFFGELYM